MSIRKAIRARFLALPTVQQFCGKRVYNSQVPNKAKVVFPLIVFKVNSRYRLKSLAGYEGITRYGIQVDIYGYSRSALEQIANDVANLEGNASGNGLLWIWHDDDSDDIEPPQEKEEKALGRITAEIKVWIAE